MALARELLGGNGVVSDFLVAKAFSDMEAIYTCAPAALYDSERLVLLNVGPMRGRLQHSFGPLPSRPCHANGAGLANLNGPRVLSQLSA